MKIIMEIKGVNDFYWDSFNDSCWNVSLPRLKVFISDPKAKMPSKNRASDIGFDITIISISQIFPSGVTLYDTGEIEIKKFLTI